MNNNSNNNKTIATINEQQQQHTMTITAIMAKTDKNKQQTRINMNSK